MKKLLTAFVALSLTACTTMSGGNFTSGTPFEQVQTRAQQALIVAWRAFDALIAAGEALRDAGVLVPGTPKAQAVGEHTLRARAALDAATEAARVGNTANFAAALAQAHQAFVEIQRALRG